MCNSLDILKSSLLLTILFALTSVNIAQDPRYCSVSERHTMCQYRGPNATCPFIRQGVNYTSHAQIVYLHNSFRSRVAAGLETRGRNGAQPPAANMNALRWDPELAEIAQRWADQCVLNYDEVRDVPGTYGYVGQNTFGFVERKVDLAPESTQPEERYWQNAIETWYNETVNFDGNTVESYQYAANNGRYTQLVYANTTAVGCGFAQYDTSNARVIRFHVCNYGAGGNRRQLPVYRRADVRQVCSQCSGSRRCEGYLCAPQEPRVNPTQ